MKAKAERRFIRKYATTVVLNYEGFAIWLVGSDDGWWECKDLATGSQLHSTTFTDLEKLIQAIDAYRAHQAAKEQQNG